MERRFPLPRIDDLLDQLSGRKVLSTLDARAGYWQIRVSEGSKEKTAFVIFEGLYQFRVLLFGLCNGPATFQWLMQYVLRGLGRDNPFCHAYIDDIIVHSDSVQEHVNHLLQVFERLRLVGLKLHPNTCRMAYPEVHYLGHVVSVAGVYPDPAKLRDLRQFPVPTAVHSVRELLGLAGYHRRFVPNFAKVAAPLHALTWQDVPFMWTEQCNVSFEKLKFLLLPRCWHIQTSIILSSCILMLAPMAWEPFLNRNNLMVSYIQLLMPVES